MGKDPLDDLIRALTPEGQEPPFSMSELAMKKRPRDPNQLGKLIADIATGELEDREATPEEQGKNAAAVALGKKGGTARAQKLNDARRKEIAQKAAISRWKRD